MGNLVLIAETLILMMSSTFFFFAKYVKDVFNLSSDDISLSMDPSVEMLVPLPPDFA